MIERNIEKFKDRLLGLIDPGKIVATEIPHPDRQLIEELLKYKGLTPTASDILDSMGIVGAVSGSELKPLQRGKTIVGPAVTARYILEKKTPVQLENEKIKGKLAEKEVYAISQPGDVAVFDAGGQPISCMGGISTELAVKAKMAGNIVNGYVRDVEEILEHGYPVWSRGVTPISGKHRLETVEINGTVICGGVTVNPGDLVIADDTGVVFIPCEYIEEVVNKMIEALKKEESVMNLIKGEANLQDFDKVLPPDKW